MAGVSVRDLNSVVGRLNREFGRPEQGWNAVGHFYVDGAYGGYALYEVVNANGGVRDVSNMGHQPRAVIYQFVRGMLAGGERVREGL